MAQLSDDRQRRAGTDRAAAFDALETRSPKQREADAMAALVRQLAHAKAHTRWFADALRDVEPNEIRTRADLARLPLLRKGDLTELQQRDPPFGGLVATPTAELARLYCSPGPIHVPEGRTGDWWRAARALHAAGFRRGDLVANTFNHHFTPAAGMMESGGRALACVMLPTGVGQPEAQAAFFARVRAAGFVGTPSFLKQVVEHAEASGLELASLRKALVTGEYLPESLRNWALARGIEVSQCYAVAEIGLIAYEERGAGGTVAPGMVLDESILVEIVRPGTGEPMPPGEVGELVVTTFNTDYPLIRFATGDLFALQPPGERGHRTNERIGNWRGRADQSTKVRGVFVHPAQVAEIMRRHAEVRRAQFKVGTDEGGDDLRLACEVAAPSAQLSQALVATVRALTKLRCSVELVAPGTLPNDGIVIDDTRKYG